MTREEVKNLLPIIQAYADGKNIQYLNKDFIWDDFEDQTFFGGVSYRIKPEPKYRPFKTTEECWNEMLKHQPFGWVKDKEGQYIQIGSVKYENNFNHYFKIFTFTDGAPFGIKDE